MTEFAGPTEHDVEAQKADEVLWSGSGVELRLPNRQAIPTEEGLHLQVVPEGNPEGSDWRRQDIKTTIKQAYYALPGARIIAESGRTPNLWANVHFNSQFVEGANVFGKNPTSETAWKRPVLMRTEGVNTPENEVNRVSLDRLAQKYLPLWQKEEVENTAIFPDGVKAMKPGDPDYQDYVENSTGGEPVIWANDKFKLVYVIKGHSNGVHLVVHPRGSYWKEKGELQKAWQTNQANAGDRDYIRGFLEMTAILKAAQAIVSEEAEAGWIKFENEEIHFSGNWAKDFDSVEDGGRLDQEDYQAAVASGDVLKIREYKRRHQAGFAAATEEVWRKSDTEEEQRERLSDQFEWQTGLHGHLYATRNPEEYVALPTRPESEVPEQWAGIKVMTPEEIAVVKKAIQDRLTSRLESINVEAKQ